MRDFTRITGFVCKRYGPEDTEAAFNAAFCGELECEKILNEVLSAIAGMALAYALLGYFDKLLEFRWVAWLFRRNTYGKVVIELLNALKEVIPDFAAKSQQIEMLEKHIEIYIRESGQIIGKVPLSKGPPG
ncbi:MAG: hypothetical protein ACWGPR_12245 [Candidatus Deferrimicrobiaceae bacterium]